MRPCSHIHLASRDVSVRFEWTGYDGDDEFDHLYIHVFSSSDTKRFDVGPCGIMAIDRLARFFRHAGVGDIGGGGRNPQGGTYAISREGHDYRIIVRFESPPIREEFKLYAPHLEFDE